MQIKRFEAENMREALRLIKQEFGSEAVILSAREVTKRGGMLKMIPKPAVEVTAATDAAYPQLASNTSVIAPEKKGESRKKIHAFYESSKKRRLLESLEIRNVKRRLNPWGKRNGEYHHNDKGLFALYRQMLKQGVSEGVAMTLVEKVDRETATKNMLSNEEMKLCLARILKEEGIVVNSVEGKNDKQRIVVLVGPTGVGKTVTVAKIAVTQGLEIGQRVGFVTLDHDRIGAFEQLKAYANIMGMPLETAWDGAELKQSLKNHADRKLVLIDTAGISHRDSSRIGELKSVLKAVPYAEVYLTLSATTKEKDLAEMIDAFRGIPITGLLFTKLDETSAYGALLNQILRTKVPLSYFAGSTEIAEGIEIASVRRLVSLIVDDEAVVREEMWHAQAGRKEKSALDDDSFEGRVANRKSGIYHYPYCRNAQRINNENMIIYKNSLEAEQGDLKPCRLCTPQAEMTGESLFAAEGSIASWR